MRLARAITGSRPLVVAAVLALAGIATAVAGYLTAAAADADLGKAELAVAALQADVAAADDALAAADAAHEAADREHTQATAELAAAADARDRLEAELGTLEDRAPAFIDAAAALVARAEETQPAILGLLDGRRGQAAALAAADYAAFNDRAGAYMEPAGTAAARLSDFFGAVEALPAVVLRQAYEYDGPPGEALAVREPVPLDPPTGPAVVVMTLPDEIICQPWGNGGCRYDWEATIEASNWLEVTITRIGVRYRGGGGYCIVGDEWADMTRVISPNGSTTWGAWLREDRDGECAPVLGGDLLVRWEGTDAEGHALSGRATADLASPP